LTIGSAGSREGISMALLKTIRDALLALLETIWDALLALVDALRHPAYWPGVLWRNGYVLWVCRVAVASAVAGGFLLAYTVQARDLFADLRIEAWQWLVFFALVFFWAWIVHAEGRKALQHDDWVPESQAGALTYERRNELQKLYWYPALWIPRLLSLVVFLLVGIAIYRTRLNLKDAMAGLPEAAQAVALAWKLLAWTVVVTLVYIALIWKARVPDDWIVPMPPGEPPQWRREPPLLAGTPLVFARWTGYKRPTPPVPRELVDFGLWGARSVIVVLLLITIFDPLLFAARSPRLFFIPVLFAGVVVLLGVVAGWSMRWRTPLLLLVVAAALILTYLTKSFHDTRWIEATVAPSKAAGQTQQISLVEAVNRWKAVNKCTDSPCPRPILIAGAGGASRAGFYTATVVGALIDLGRDKTKGAPYGDIRSRIFALSTVSGGSAGAAVIRAALLDAAARNDPDTPPCRIAGTGSWFGRPLMGADGLFDPRKNWRDCFQAVLAGDFLSPAFVGLAIRDNFPFINPFTGRPAWSDRAVLLEQAFERRYRRYTAQDGRPLSCPRRPPQGGSEGLCRPFGYHPDPKTTGAWVPIFFINGTSVFTGRRIVVGDVATTNRYQGDTPLMPLAYDLNDVRKRKTTGQENKPAVEKGTDIRLSTAATMSARFPVVSPQGLLRTLHGDVTDQIVDGGYFENDGLATIMDVAAALRRLGLHPVVVRIANEPTPPEDPAADTDKPPVPVPADRSLFDDVFAIARALVAARAGHEDAYTAAIKSALAKESYLYEIGVYDIAPRGPGALRQRSMTPASNPVCRREIKNRARLAQVSMSWWLSQPVQAYLDAQLCLPANWERLECELRHGRTSPGAECPRPAPVRTDRLGGERAAG
jgi:hypothetical protein